MMQYCMPQQGSTLLTTIMTCILFAQHGCRYGRFEAVGEQIVAFLRDLFGERVLKSNLILVVTGVSNGKKAMKERKDNSQTLESIIDGVRMKVQKAFGLQHSLMAIDIDTMPVSPKRSLYMRTNPLVLISPKQQTTIVCCTSRALSQQHQNTSIVCDPAASDKGWSLVAFLSYGVRLVTVCFNSDEWCYTYVVHEQHSVS